MDKFVNLHFTLLKKNQNFFTTIPSITNSHKLNFPHTSTLTYPNPNNLTFFTLSSHIFTHPLPQILTHPLPNPNTPLRSSGSRCDDNKVFT